MPSTITAALDAWAVLAFLRDEPSAKRVEEAAVDGCVCSWINLGEALYIEARRVDLSSARAFVEGLADNVLAELPDVRLVQTAAQLKAEGGLSYADCFAVATAERHRVPLLTGDPEILELGRAELELIDLREIR